MNGPSYVRCGVSLLRCHSENRSGNARRNRSHGSGEASSDRRPGRGSGQAQGRGRPARTALQKQFEAEKSHGKVLEKKFDELFKRAKENPDTKPPTSRSEEHRVVKECRSLW